MLRGEGSSLLLLSEAVRTLANNVIAGEFSVEYEPT